MIKFKELMDMYDNWNGVTKVNTVINNEWITIERRTTYLIMDERKDLYDKEVLSFGFYDNEFCVRI